MDDLAATPRSAVPVCAALRVLGQDDVVRLHAESLALLGLGTAPVERAVALAPRAFLLGGREPSCDVVLDGRRPRLAAGSAAALLRPCDGGPPRAATEADLSYVCRVADALPEVACLVGPPVRAEGLTRLGELACCLASCGKHIQITTLHTEVEAEHVVRMAEVLAGSPEEATARPPFSLRAHTRGARAALVFARARLPVGLVLEGEVAGPSPSGIAGVLARHHAAVLAGLLAVQDEAPGAPFFYPTPAAQDLAGVGDSEAALLLVGAMQLAAHVGLPVSADAFATGAADLGWQGCADNALTSLAVAMSGGAVLAGAGTLARGQVLSPEGLVMDAEIFSWNARIAEGLLVDDDTMALSTIKEVGIGGNYLGQRHTRRHMRGVWRPRLLDRASWDSWNAAGRPQPPELARALVANLLRSHEVAPLDAALADALAGIVAETAERGREASDR